MKEYKIIILQGVILIILAILSAIAGIIFALMVYIGWLCGIELYHYIGFITFIVILGIIIKDFLSWYYE
jgi:hypothetical protein